MSLLLMLPNGTTLERATSLLLGGIQSSSCLPGSAFIYKKEKIAFYGFPFQLQKHPTAPERGSRGSFWCGVLQKRKIADVGIVLRIQEELCVCISKLTLLGMLLSGCTETGIQTQWPLLQHCPTRRSRHYTQSWGKTC